MYQKMKNGSIATKFFKKNKCKKKKRARNER